MRHALLESVSMMALKPPSSLIASLVRTVLLVITGTTLTTPALAQSVTNAVANAAATNLLSPFTSLPASTFRANLQTTIAINNAATPAQRAQAYSDAENLGPSVSAAYGSTQSGIAQLSNGLGPKASAALSTLINPSSAGYNAAVFNVFNQAYTVSGADSSFDKTFFGNLHIYDGAYQITTATGDPRPYQVTTNQIQLYTGSDFPAAPYGLPGTVNDLTTSPAFPSGHTTGGWTYALLEAMMVPERFQQELTRGSQYGYNRIVLGVHYALDTIGGRILALQDVSNLLNNVPGYTGVTYGSGSSAVTIPADFAGAFTQATGIVRSAVQQSCGTSIAVCVANTFGDQFSNAAQNKANYVYQLTYGLAPVGPTNLAPVVPTGAEVLLATRFPYLTAAQRRDVLATTELPSGFPLDNGSGWARLNLYEAGGGYDALNSDTTVMMDASQGGFNALDLWSNAISGPGRLIKTGTGMLILTGNNSFGGLQVSGGTVMLTGVNTFPGASQVYSGGTLAFGIDGSAPGTGPGAYAQINATGTGTFLAGGTLMPAMGTDQPTTSGYKMPALGTTYSLVTTAAANGVSGRFANLSVSNATQALLSPNTSFGVSYYGNAVTLYITPSSYANPVAAGFTPTANQAAVGAALDRVRANAGAGGILATADTSAMLGAVGSLGAANLATGLSQLSGVGTLNTAGTSLTVGRAIGQALDSRFNQLHANGTSISEKASQGLFGFALNTGNGNGPNGGGQTGAATGLAAGDGQTTGLSPWVRGVGVFSSNSGDGNAPGFQSTIGGGVAGTDFRVTDSLVLGASFGYAHSMVTGSDGTGEADGDSYRFTGYGTWNPGTFFVDGTLGYTYSTFDTRRDLAMGRFSGSAKGNTSGGDVEAGLRVGKQFSLGGFAVEPDAGLTYDRITTDRFTESGAGAFNLTVGQTTLDSLRSAIGGRISRTFQLEDGLALEPELRAHWEHEVLDQNARSTLSLVGQPYTISSARPGRDAAVLGVGLAGLISSNVRVFAAYDASLRANQTDHAVTAGVKIDW